MEEGKRGSAVQRSVSRQAKHSTPQEREFGFEEHRQHPAQMALPQRGAAQRSSSRQGGHAKRDVLYTTKAKAGDTITSEDCIFIAASFCGIVCAWCQPQDLLDLCGGIHEEHPLPPNTSASMGHPS